MKIKNILTLEFNIELINLGEIENEYQVITDAELALEKLKGDNPDQDQGIQIARQAMQEPLRQIVTNAGEEGSVILAKVEEGKDSFGYKSKTLGLGFGVKSYLDKRPELIDVSVEPKLIIDGVPHPTGVKKT